MFYSGVLKSIQTYPEWAAAFQWIYQLANICLHLIIEAKRDISGVTPGKRYATDDKPPVAADDASERGFIQSVCLWC